MSTNYDDDRSEDGELARSPIQDEMDFSLSDEDPHADALIIKPPQAVVKSSHRDRRHKKSAKDRYKDVTRKEKKHLYRDREKYEKNDISKPSDRDGAVKDYYREKQYYREKDMYREKEVRDRETYRDKDMYKEKEIRVEKDYYREKELRDKEVYREREFYREKETAYKEKSQYRPEREREAYRDSASYRDAPRSREVYREKGAYKDIPREGETYSRDAPIRYADDRKQKKDSDHGDQRTRFPADENRSASDKEKDNRDKTSGDKELEDLRSRLLSKRIGKDISSGDSRRENSVKESKSDRHSTLDKHQQERRKRLLEAEREMEKRKHESRTELEARREERRRRGKKRTMSPEEISNKKSKRAMSPVSDDAVVMVSDCSDEELEKSESSNSEPEEGEHSKTDTENDSSSTDTDSARSKSEDEDEARNDSDKSDLVNSTKNKSRNLSKSPPQMSSVQHSNSSHDSKKSRSKSRSRSHSFSPPPPGENGKQMEETPQETDEEALKREEEMNLLPPYFPALQGCRSVEEFQCLNRIEEGTYGVVYRARDKTTEEIVALKRLKMEKEKEGFPITSLREINTLLKGQHPNIVTCREIVVGSNMDKIFIVMDYVEHDLKSLMETMRAKKQVFLPGEVKCLMTQLLSAVHHLHDNWILHRDLKTSNLLLSHKGILKVGDFGLAREYGSPLRAYTPIVVTLWYRAPELLLCCKEYSTHIDIWSVGCIFAEFITMNPLFPGKSEVDQLNRIFKDLGTPSESIWSGYKDLPAVQKMTFTEYPVGGLKQRIGNDLLSEAGQTLLNGFLTYDPSKRITADAALEHVYFKEHPVAIDPSMFPTWPAKSEGSKRTTHSPRPPAGGAAYPRDNDDSVGFRVQGNRSINVAPGFSLKF